MEPVLVTPESPRVQGLDLGHVLQPPPSPSSTPATQSGRRGTATATATSSRSRSRRRQRRSNPPASRTPTTRRAAAAAAAAIISNSLEATRPRKKKDPASRRLFAMSTTGKWREEQVLIVCPGSRTTMAQLGCNELTLPARRMPTRMFRDGAQWAPFHRTKRTRVVNGQEGGEEEWVEDVDEDEGAVYPIQAGRIIHMDAFLAFLDHVHGLLTTTYHNTPIMLMASPQWTRPDCETIARYVFENTRTPALCIIHSGIATQYGLKWPHMTVIDIGHEKVDVTAIHDGRVVNHTEVSAAAYGPGGVSGGEAFTKSLQRLLTSKGFSRDMAEQLKKSNICEVLPYAGAAKELMELPAANAAAAAAAAASLSAPEGSVTTTTAEVDPKINHPLDEGENTNGSGEDDGVLDVATIVTTGQTKEFLAKKEKEKEKEKGKGGRKKADKDADAAANKPVRLPNAKRLRNTFFYEEVVMEDVPEPAESAVAAPTVPTPTVPVAAASVAAAPVEKRPKRVRKDMEVGLERFTFASRSEIDRIVTAVYRCIQDIGDMYMRPPCWDNLVFVGNGSRLRGLKENILQTLHARHLVSPSTATIFTSELPSNMATPTGTGAQTPVGSFTGAPHMLPPPSGVNPLLQAATTASAGAAATATAGGGVGTPAAGSEAGGPVSGSHFHSQTPTSIRTAQLPTYLSEWAKNGFEESMFLGAQVAARIAFCLHTNMDASGLEAQRLMSLSRVDYNELGPKGIRSHSMLG